MEKFATDNIVLSTQELYYWKTNGDSIFRSTCSNALQTSVGQKISEEYNQ